MSSQNHWPMIQARPERETYRSELQKSRDCHQTLRALVLEAIDLILLDIENPQCSTETVKQLFVQLREKVVLIPA